MVYLSQFRFPTRKEEQAFLSASPKMKRTIYSSKYPFSLFEFRDMPTLDFQEITVFYGNNGSGKSTVLNVIAETLGLPRETPYNRSDFFEDYTALCKYKINGRILSASKIITSDDVFDKVLDIRRLNDGIDNRRDELISEYVNEQHEARSGVPNTFTGLEDYENWKRRSDMRRSTSSQFIRKNLIRNVEERSNGESALAYFVDAIADGGLYLLDEPENSLSPSNQLQLKYFLEDCARHHSCQFIISTHSPFLLSLRSAKIYDLDRQPISTAESWTELDAVRTYFDFFEENREKFL